MLTLPISIIEICERECTRTSMFFVYILNLANVLLDLLESVTELVSDLFTDRTVHEVWISP